jgi:AcrR family transcriptional regulator
MPSLDEGARRRVGAPDANGEEEEYANDPNPKGRQGAHVSEMQRRRLLSAIIEVLAEHGLEGTTVGRICKHAGVSRRTFYDLFDDRDACFSAAFELAIERLSQRVAPAYTAGGSWRERIRSALTALLKCFDSEPGLAGLCLMETLKGGSVVLQRRRVLLEALTVAIDEGRQEAKSANPPPLTAESAVGGALSVVHARLLTCSSPRGGSSPTKDSDHRPLVELVNPLMSMIVLPYLGPAAARRELDRPVPASPAVSNSSNGHVPAPASDPFRDLAIRITFRTVRVLSTIGELGGRGIDPSNREIGQSAGVPDQGQMSKLLRRLQNAKLIENHGQGQTRGEANAWRLTPQGHAVLHAIGADNA